MVIAYYIAADDGTFWRAEKDLNTGAEDIEQITADEYLDAMNAEVIQIEDWT